MIVKKPSIFIYTHLADEAILREVCAGVEEEGVFYEITEFPDECMEKLSYKAARDSMLGSGIGIFGTAVCLKMRGLEKGRNIEAYLSRTKEQSAEEKHSQRRTSDISQQVRSLQTNMKKARLRNRIQNQEKK